MEQNNIYIYIYMGKKLRSRNTSNVKYSRKHRKRKYTKLKHTKRSNRKNQSRKKYKNRRFKYRTLRRGGGGHDMPWRGFTTCSKETLMDMGYTNAEAIASDSKYTDRKMRRDEYIEELIQPNRCNSGNVEYSTWLDFFQNNPIIFIGAHGAVVEGKPIIPHGIANKKFLIQDGRTGAVGGPGNGSLFAERVFYSINHKDDERNNLFEEAGDGGVQRRIFPGGGSDQYPDPLTYWIPEENGPKCGTMEDGEYFREANCPKLSVPGGNYSNVGYSFHDHNNAFSVDEEFKKPGIYVYNIETVDQLEELEQLFKTVGLIRLSVWNQALAPPSNQAQAPGWRGAPPRVCGHNCAKFIYPRNQWGVHIDPGSGEARYFDIDTLKWTMQKPPELMTPFVDETSELKLSDLMNLKFRATIFSMSCKGLLLSPTTEAFANSYALARRHSLGHLEGSVEASRAREVAQARHDAEKANAAAVDSQDRLREQDLRRKRGETPLSEETLTSAPQSESPPPVPPWDEMPPPGRSKTSGKERDERGKPDAATKRLLGYRESWVLDA
jgi:hypothetical protein